ncbi:hypothetical protein [Nocardioides sp. CER19]|uniref:hypothetical protein n=1 Tax=Nocardioides sp. CER19 TaxID=3038538 RepID=UPI00244A7971|nr:hypothetical protein [Nocardioides sp. CER19]MDH2413918.1 hypothetical protein [Nocardioides sp. CER19]
MDPSLDEKAQLPDGVLVIRAVRGVAGGRQVFRVTTGTGEGEQPATAVVADVQALHDAVDAWVAGLRSV